MRATRLLWALAGKPEPATPLCDEAGVCATCGLPSAQTAQIDKVLGANFADRSHIMAETSRICPACVWCASGKPPATLRMWSVVASPGVDLGPSHPKAWLQNTPGLLLTNRANPQPIAETLGNPPDGEWVVTVAYSSQKHVVPYATTNRGGGRWTIRVEDHNITSTPTEWVNVHNAAMALRKLGVPADAVRVGEPRNIRTREDLATWRERNAAIQRYLTSPLLDLALWTITKGTMS